MQCYYQLLGFPHVCLLSAVSFGAGNTLTVQNIESVLVIDGGHEPSITSEFGLGLLLENPLVLLPSVDHEHPWFLLTVLSLDVNTLLFLPSVQNDWIRHNRKGWDKKIDTNLFVSIITELDLNFAIQVPL